MLKNHGSLEAVHIKNEIFNIIQLIKFLYLFLEFLKRNKNFLQFVNNLAINIFEIKQSPTSFLPKTSLIRILFWPILPILLSGTFVFPFDSINHSGETEENKYTIFHNLKTIFHVLPHFQITLTCFFIHPYLQVDKLFLYFDSNTIQTSCYIFYGTN